MEKEFDYLKFKEEYGVCLEEIAKESELEEKEDLLWDALLTK